MAEETRRILACPPFDAALRPQCSEFPCLETRFYAQNRVLASHGIDADRAHQAACDQREPGAARLAGKETVTSRRDGIEQRPQPRPVEMVQKKIDNDKIPARRRAAPLQKIRVAMGPYERVRHTGPGRPARACKTLDHGPVDKRLGIQQSQFHFWELRAQGARHTEHQAAVAGAEFQHAQRRGVAPAGHHGQQGALQDRPGAHDAMDALQVATRLHRGRVVFFECVERLDAHSPGKTHAWTFSSAPWQQNPAPNDESHHQPPGASSAIAAASTK